MSVASGSFHATLLAAGLALMVPVAAHAGQKGDAAFFDQVAGQWSGPGEIVAGKYKGTKFACNLKGTSGEVKPGMALDGVCRVGLFTEKVSASVEAVKGGYSGRFMDGAEGKGLDVVGGNVTGNNKVVLSLNRAQLNGAMVARMKGGDAMVVTVSVRVEGKMIPVIGMNLKRTDAVSVGSIASE